MLGLASHVLVDEPLQFLPQVFSGTAANLPEIAAAASGAGSFNIITDADSIVRRISFVLRLGDEIYPTLSAEAIRVYQGATGNVILKNTARGNGTQAYEFVTSNTYGSKLNYTGGGEIGSSPWANLEL